MEKTRLAAVGDLHVRETSHGAYKAHFADLHQEADFLLLCGDLTESGLPKEMEVLLGELSSVRIPIFATLGNHDCQHGQEDVLVSIMTDAGIRYVDNTSFIEDDGIGFAGAKGFGGGFENASLQPWGEKILKDFVYEAIAESLKIEAGLAKLDCPKKVVIMHYSPIKATLAGENPEVFPFLGSSRLSDPIDQYGASVVFHSHAHHGSPQGVTNHGIPVHNVSLPLIRRLQPGRYYSIFEL
ncbi:MAG: metallophosphoesterase [Chloroflexi bacterium]|nr:metallophosphoesterase [Chloroflexota bacterium]